MLTLSTYRFRGEQTIGFSGLRSWSWEKFLGLAYRASKRLPYAAGHEVVLQPDQAAEGLLLLFACLMGGLRPVLDPKKSRETSPSRPLLHADEVGCQALLMQEAADCPLSFDTLLACLFACDDAPALVFSTSGSTGEPTLCPKTWTGLFKETSALGSLYELRPATSVVSLVSPFHIYGFLHGVLLPLTHGASSYHLPTSLGFLDYDTPVEAVGLLVASPALWGLARKLITRLPVSCFVSSGAAFGKSRREDLAAMPTAPLAAWEILGSTESGGLGYRSLRAGDDAFYRCLPGVSLHHNAERFWVSSPFLTESAPLGLGDELVLAASDSSLFQHLGRRDRIFKYAGKRFALSEIEVTLQKHLGQRQLACHFFCEADTTRGGTLVAVVEGAPVRLHTLRQAYVQSTNLPFPEKIHFVDQLIYDQMGKVDLPASLALCQEPPA